MQYSVRLLLCAGMPYRFSVVQYSNQFGYSRKDVLLIGGVLLGGGFALYYGLQSTGMEPGMAGNVVQAGIFLLLCLGWVASYLLRVVNKVSAMLTWWLGSFACAVMQHKSFE